MKRSLLLVLLLSFSVAWVNCSDDNGGSSIDPDDPSTFVGNWTIVSFTDNSGEACLGATPCVLEPGEEITIPGVGTLVMTSGTLVLNDNPQRYTFTFNLELSGQALPPVQSTGTWEINGNQITIDPDDDDPETATFSVNGNRVTINTPDGTIVVEKQ